MEYRFKPSGRICAREMVLDIEDNIIKDAKIIGGCAGNTIGISVLVKGMSIDEAIKKLKGIPCGLRGTSCPDQLAIALEEFKTKIV